MSMGWCLESNRETSPGITGKLQLEQEVTAMVDVNEGVQQRAMGGYLDCSIMRAI
jgi:hypothetical protein